METKTKAAYSLHSFQIKKESNDNQNHAEILSCIKTENEYNKSELSSSMTSGELFFHIKKESVETKNHGERFLCMKKENNYHESEISSIVPAKPCFHIKEESVDTPNHFGDYGNMKTEREHIKSEVSTPASAELALPVPPFESTPCQRPRSCADSCTCDNIKTDVTGDFKLFKLEAMSTNLQGSINRDSSIHGTSALSDIGSNLLRFSTSSQTSNRNESNEERPLSYFKRVIVTPAVYPRLKIVSSPFVLPVAKTPFQCPNCSQKFTTKSCLNIHVNIHHSSPAFPCPHCKKVFTRKCHFTAHVNTQHSSSQPTFPCMHCDRVFRQKGHLTTHIKTLHSDSPPTFPCPNCEKVFLRKGLLTAHVNTYHSSYPCIHCNKAFTWCFF